MPGPDETTRGPRWLPAPNLDPSLYDQARLEAEVDNHAIHAADARAVTARLREDYEPNLARALAELPEWMTSNPPARVTGLEANARRIWRETKRRAVLAWEVLRTGETRY